jgi:acetoacetyl-CoA synthetase
LPGRRGIIQTRALGVAVNVYDDNAKPVLNQKGELVCTAPFPSMPVGFWNDPDGKRYHDAYFDRFPNIWCHGDYVELDDTGGMIIYGRSDATLNPGGVRIGTAEIYRQVELLPEIQESIVIGQQWDNDVRVVLFVVLKPGVTLDDALSDRIRKQIRSNCTPRHVPAKIVAVNDIPRTKSGKITELAVRDVVHGRKVKNQEALANPEALDLYADLDILKN